MQIANNQGISFSGAFRVPLAQLERGSKKYNQLYGYISTRADAWQTDKGVLRFSTKSEKDLNALAFLKNKGLDFVYKNSENEPVHNMNLNVLG